MTDLNEFSERGFLADPNAPVHLDGEFAAWTELAESAGGLLAERRFGKQVASLPLIEATPPEQSLPLAKLALSFLVQAFVWEPAMDDAESPRLLVPTQLCLPLMRVSAALDEPPIFNYADNVLRNMRLVDADGPYDLDNLKAAFLFSGTPDEDRFVVVHAAYEAVGVEGIRKGVEAIESDDDAVAAAALIRCAEILAALREQFLAVKDTVSPVVFRERVRLFLLGWSGNLPGIRFDGAALDPSVLRGETGAQSALLPFFDEMLGAIAEEPAAASKLSSEEVAAALEVYRDFARYRPRQHREFLKRVGARSTLRARAKRNAELRDGYNRALAGVVNMRRAHLDTVGEYLRSGTHSVMQRGLGTGGSSYAAYLGNHVVISEAAHL